MGVRVGCLATVLDAHDVLLTSKQRLVASTFDNSLVELGGQGRGPFTFCPANPTHGTSTVLWMCRGSSSPAPFDVAVRSASGPRTPMGPVVSSRSQPAAWLPTGFRCPAARVPHGLWLICDSAQHDLIEIDPENPSERIRTVGLGVIPAASISTTTISMLESAGRETMERNLTATSSLRRSGTKVLETD